MYPFEYTIRYRLNTAKQKFYFFLYYCVPLIAFPCLTDQANWPQDLIYATSLVIINLTYELGYIRNDLISLRRAKGRNRIAMYGIDEAKCTVTLLSNTLLILSLFAVLLLFQAERMLEIFILTVSLYSVYALHNHVESNAVKVLTFLSLRVLRFSPIIMYSHNDGILTHATTTLILAALTFNILDALQYLKKINTNKYRPILMLTLLAAIWTNDFDGKIIAVYYLLLSISTPLKFMSSKLIRYR
jgi:hypothetical protein